MKSFVVFLAMTLPVMMNAQDCTCSDNWNWVKTTFEQNDAGYDYAMESKSTEAYEAHNNKFEKLVGEITDPNECQRTIYEWLTFFRSGHIAISSLNNQASNTSNEKPSDDDIRSQFKDWERYEIDMEQFEADVNESTKSGIEGIWTSGPYKIGIKETAAGYIGFIMQADGVYWTEKQVKLKIQHDKSATYYMRDHSAEEFEEAALVGYNTLEIGFITLQRFEPTQKDDPNIIRYQKAISARMPYFEILDEQTTYLRIPSFNGSLKKYIDSVILANEEVILSTENFIIDIRNNGGGSDNSYAKLLPIMYTNPIRSVGVEYLSTPRNNERMNDFVRDPKYGFSDADKEWARKSHLKLSKYFGEFVNLKDNVVDIITYDTIYEYPKNIAILINENNGSTAEQFLLDANQSRKVSLMGTTTVGVLDISNMYFIPSPCNEFELGYCLTRSMRIPGMTIDGKGIQPDFYIDKSVPKHDWIQFARNVFSF